MFVNQTPATSRGEVVRLVEQGGDTKLSNGDVHDYVILIDEATAIAVFREGWTADGIELVREQLRQARETYGEIDLDLLPSYAWELGADTIERIPDDPDLWQVYVYPTSTRGKRLRQRKNFTTPDDLFHFNYDNLWAPSTPGSGMGMVYSL